MDEQVTFQLERWTGREYMPHGAPLTTDNPHKAGELADTARMLGLPRWRVCRADKARPARPSRWRPSPSRTPSRSIEKVQRQYLEWAAAHGVTCVAVYADKRAADVQMRAHALNISSYRVDPAEFLGPAPAAETIPEGE